VERVPYVEQKAELRVRGQEAGDDFDPDDLTALLGVGPSLVWRRGEALRSGRHHLSTIWWWETAYQVGRDSEAMVLQVLDVFEPLVKRLDEAKARWGVALELGLVVTMYVATQVADGVPEVVAATPAMALSAETLGRLAGMGVSFDADLYVDEVTSSE
jgi:hypothetical protein